MKYENIKSIILTLLVVTSAILTWNLWTYQPKYPTVDKSIVEEVALSERKEMGQLIKPEEILFHFNYSHFGTTNNDEIKQITQEIYNWKFYDLEDISTKVKNIPEFVHEKGNAEIIFPDAIPIELYNKIITIEDKKIPEFSFNRIIIDVDHKNKEDGTVYFVHYGNPDYHKIVTSHIKLDTMKKFEKEFFNVSTKMTRYFSEQLTNQSVIFLPENRRNFISYKYFLEQLDPEKFKEALFDDPTVVQKYDQGVVVEFSDASSMMEVNKDSNILSYINPVEERDDSTRTTDLLKKSIDFVNEHGGWTGLYRYESLDEKDMITTFRLYNEKGIPIFNDSGLTEIIQLWGEKNIYKYIRPTIALNVPLRTESKDITLISGKEALEKVKNKAKFKPELLEKIVVGYKMTRNRLEPQLVSLEPTWFYKYNGKWDQITDDNLGGLKHGLE